MYINYHSQWGLVNLYITVKYKTTSLYIEPDKQSIDDIHILFQMAKNKIMTTTQKLATVKFIHEFCHDQVTICIMTAYGNQNMSRFLRIVI
jgi:virulence-associated protein VagC